MAWKVTSQSTYDKLIIAFRENWGNFSSAARAAGVARKTAKKAWISGWPDQRMRPIRDLLEEERLAARAEILTETRAKLVGDQAVLQQEAVEAEKARLLSHSQAVQTRAQEGEMVKLSRANTIVMMATANRHLRVANKLAKELEEQVEKGEVELTPQQVIKLAGSCAFLTKTAAEAARINLEMERILLGEPTEIIGIDVNNMSVEEAARRIEVANRALERARKRGLLGAPNNACLDNRPDSQPEKPN